MLRVLFHPQVSKEILKIPKKERLRIIRKIAELEKLDYPLQHKRIIKLKGRNVEDFRLRVGDYRIKFTLRDHKTVLITHIHHRQAGY